VTTEVNASASRLGGWRGILRRDLVLTIGLPLIASFNVRQVTGVFSHEFGHCGQGTGMGLSIVIQRVNTWFARVVHERDQWDERLHAWTQKYGVLVFFIVKISQGFVWLTRRLLAILMGLGHMFSGFLGRQMEYDADRHGVRLTGSDDFARTLRDLRVLSLAEQWAEMDQAELMREDRLSANLPGLIAAQTPQILRREELVG